MSNSYKNIDVIKYRNNPVSLLDDFSLLDFPVNLNKLAKKLEINLDYKNCDKNLSGKIEYKHSSNTVNIYINNQEPKFRQRFSLAHEISHFIYDFDFQQDKDKYREDSRELFRKDLFNPIERRADKFAEQLLMPKELFRNQALKLKTSLFQNTKLKMVNIYTIVKKLSDLFEVSIPAVIFRLNSIELIKESMRNNLFSFHNQIR